MSDSQLIAKIGETVWGASWQAAMATAVRQSRYTIEAWASGREPIPLEMWKELREATRLHYLKLADLDLRNCARIRRRLSARHGR
jgi:hypothetical protein